MPGSCFTFAAPGPPGYVSQNALYEMASKSGIVMDFDAVIELSLKVFCGLRYDFSFWKVKIFLALANGDALESLLFSNVMP